MPLAIISTRFLGEVERIQTWVAHLLACLARAPRSELATLLLLDEADLFMPAGTVKPPSKEPLQDLAAGGRIRGHFSGTLHSINSSPATTRAVAATFDVPVPE